MTVVILPAVRPDGPLVLCPLTADVLDPFTEAALAAATAVRPWMGAAMAPATPEAVAAFVQEWTSARAAGTGYGFAGMEASGRCVGFGLLNALHPRHRFANVGYWVRPEAAGRGYGAALTGMLARFGFDALGLQRLELIIEPGNAASQRVAERVGAVYEGHLRHRLCIDGAVRDALLYSLLPSDLRQ